MRKARLILYDFMLFTFWCVMGVPLLVPAVWGGMALYVVYYFAPFPWEAIGSWGWTTIVLAMVCWYTFYKTMVRGRTSEWVRNERILMQKEIGAA